MSPALAVLALAAAAPVPVVISSPGFVGPDIEPQHLAYYSGYFANQLRLQGVKVIDTADGAEAVVEGRLVPFGPDGVQIDLKVRQGDETIAARSVTAANELELTQLLSRSAQELASELFHRFDRMPVTQEQAVLQPLPGSTQRSPVPGLVAAAVGVVGCATGVALVFVAKDKLAAVRTGAPSTYPAAMSDAAAARSLSTAGFVVMAIGAAALVGGATYSLIASRGDASLTMSPVVTPSGFALTGTFP